MSGLSLQEVAIHSIPMFQRDTGSGTVFDWFFSCQENNWKPAPLIRFQGGDHLIAASLLGLVHRQVGATHYSIQ